MRFKVGLLVGALVAFISVAFGQAAPTAHADYFQYPCNYPFVGIGADIDILVHGGGQYCDGPMEINGSHYHCEAGNGGIGGGAIGIGPAIAGINLGGFGGSGIGMSLEGCHFVCPDKSLAPFPNPPAAWIKPLVLVDALNDCKGHMTPAGVDGAPVPSNLPPEGAPTPPLAPQLATPEPTEEPNEGGMELLAPGNPMPVP